MPRPCSKLLCHFVAVCLNLAQVLPTFTSLLNVLLNMTKTLGLLRVQLVRLCINVSIKKRQPSGLPQDVVDAPEPGTNGQTQGRLCAALASNASIEAAFSNVRPMSSNPFIRQCLRKDSTSKRICSPSDVVMT